MNKKKKNRLMNAFYEGGKSYQKHPKFAISLLDFYMQSITTDAFNVGLRLGNYFEGFGEKGSVNQQETYKDGLQALQENHDR